MFCIMHIGSRVQSQEDNTNTLPYLEELRQALFPPDEPKINAKDHLNCIETSGSRYFTEWEELDSIIMVRVNQPDKKLVCDLLLKIALTKDYAYYQPLMDMYELHQEYFKKEWMYVRQNYHMHIVCKAKNDPVIIMHGFEHVLFILKLSSKNIHQSELILLFDNFIRTNYEKRDFSQEKVNGEDIKNEKQIIKFEYYSDYFIKGRSESNIWWVPLVGFGFHSAFIEELEDHMIEKIVTMNVSDFNKQPNENFEAYFRVKEFFYILASMKNIGSHKFEQALESIFDDFAQTGYIVRIFEYAQQNKEISPQFIRFLLNKLYTHEEFKDDVKVQQTFTGMMGYMLNTHTRPVIKQYLLERLEAKNNEERLRTLSYLVYFTNDPEVLQLMLDKSKQKNLTPEESKVLRHNFDRMLKAPDFPEESKDAVKQSLKKLPYEKQ